MGASTPEALHVAIIGAGITGVNLALGLLARGVSFTLYERAPCFGEIGAGIGFSPNAERAMGALSPDVLAAFKRVANPNGEDYFQWVDGHGSGNLFFKLHVGKDGFQGGRRSDILDAWAKLVPPDTVQFGKEIDTITQPPSTHKLRLHFKDGSTADADAVIGCDGIRSRVRHLLLPPSSPAIQPGYTRKFCFRALAPLSAAIAAIGEHASTTRFMYIGPGAHVITYPVANNTLLNILAVLSEPDSGSQSGSGSDWPHASHTHTAPGHKREAAAAFRGWHETVRGIVDLFPDEMEKWAIFDMAAHPAPAYTKGRVCVAGDAAHATGPHLGAGGGMGIEDALALAALMEEVKKRVEQKGGEEKKGELVERALEVYEEVRYTRTQEVVKATREACDLFHWRDERGRDPERFGREITEKFHRIWNYDVDEMVEEALELLDQRAA